MRRGGTGWPGLAAALVVHGGLLGFLFLATPPAPQAAVRRPPVKVTLMTRRPPPPAPAPEPDVVVDPTPTPEPPATRPPVRKPRPRPREAARPTPPPPPESAPVESPPAAPATPPATTPAPADSPPPTETTTAPRRFAVALGATVSGGGVAVPTASDGSGWAFGSPDGRPDGARELAGPAPAVAGPERSGSVPPFGAAEVTRLPRLLEQPSSRELRRAYPPQARADGREADVSLKILVAADGEVERVRVLRGADPQFDAAAVELVRRFRFAPAIRAGRPVAVWIPWTYKFRLES